MNKIFGTYSNALRPVLMSRGESVQVRLLGLAAGVHIFVAIRIDEVGLYNAPVRHLVDERREGRSTGHRFLARCATLSVHLVQRGAQDVQLALEVTHEAIGNLRVGLSVVNELQPHAQAHVGVVVGATAIGNVQRRLRQLLEFLLVLHRQEAVQRRIGAKKRDIG